MTAEQYATAVAYERDLGLTHVRLMLDGLCEDLGLGRAAWRYWPGARVIL